MVCNDTIFLAICTTIPSHPIPSIHPPSIASTCTSLIFADPCNYLHSSPRIRMHTCTIYPYWQSRSHGQYRHPGYLLCIHTGDCLPIYKSGDAGSTEGMLFCDALDGHVCEDANNSMLKTVHIGPPRLLSSSKLPKTSS